MESENSTYIVEFMGMPRAGKSSTLNYLKNSLCRRTNKNRVRVISEGARICPLYRDYRRFYFHSWSLNTTINALLESTQLGWDYILMDRGIYDSMVFASALHKYGEITKDQYFSLSNYCNQFVELNDLTFLFMIDIEESIIRRSQGILNVRRDNSKVRFLELLREAYFEFIEANSKSEKVVVIDGSEDFKFNSLVIEELVKTI